MVRGCLYGCVGGCLARFSLARVRLTRASLPRCTLTRFQLGAFQFGAMPVWRVSLWRVSHFCANCTEVFSTSVWHVSRFAPMLIEYASMVCSTRSIYVCGYVSFLRRSVFYARISFCVFFLCVSCIISLLKLSTCHRGYTIADLFISRLRLQNGCATQHDVGVVIVQCSRSEDLKTFLLHLFD